MTQLTATFEAGTNTNTIATGDAGSATAWDHVYIGTAGEAKYDTTHAAHGALGAKMNHGTDHYSVMGWSTAWGTATELWGRTYVYLTGYPSTYVQLVKGWEQANRSNLAFMVRIDSSGVLFAHDADFGGYQTSAAIPLNQWVRVEWHVVCAAGTGQYELKVFHTADSSTPTETVPGDSVRNTRTKVMAFDFGPIDGTADNGYTVWMDDIVVNTTGYPGSAVPAASSLVYNPRPLAHLRAR